jgi:hypothetical protein
MTATTFHPGLSGRRARTDTVLMLAAANRGALTHQVCKPWPQFLVNDQLRPEARAVITQLIAEGLLYITHPDRAVSDVKPTPTGLAKIGACL